MTFTSPVIKYQFKVYLKTQCPYSSYFFVECELTSAHWKETYLTVTVILTETKNRRDKAKLFVGFLAHQLNKSLTKYLSLTIFKYSRKTSYIGSEPSFLKSFKRL